jgi:hypothetical protein
MCNGKHREKGKAAHWCMLLHETAVVRCRRREVQLRNPDLTCLLWKTTCTGDKSRPIETEGSSFGNSVGYQSGHVPRETRDDIKNK